MPLLRFNNVFKRFNSIEVLHGVSFDAEAGQVLGLVGENGSGKSTCMNILGGVVSMTSGSMTLDGEAYTPQSPRDALNARVAFVHQELNLFTQLSIEENIFIDQFPRRASWLPIIDRKTVRQVTTQLLEQVGLDRAPQTTISRLSQGERQMVEIAKGLRSDARLMIFDEPTTSLTHQECERLFEIITDLRNRGLGIIYISHILDDVLALSDQVVVLRDGNCVASCEAKDVTNAELVKHMVGREISQLYPERKASQRPALPKRLSVTGLCQPGIVEDIDLEIAPGEILGLAGMMGAGRTELARILFGLDPFQRGTVKIDGVTVGHLSPKACAKAGMAFVTEDRREEGLLLAARIRTNVAVASLDDYASPRAGLLNLKQLADAADRSASASGLVDESPWGKLVRNLSGGNQQKVVLAKWMMRNPLVLILDEPTRGIDIGARYQIYNSIAELADAGSAVLLISSELEELIGLCDRISVMRRGEISDEFCRDDFDLERMMEAAIWSREVAT